MNIPFALLRAVIFSIVFVLHSAVISLFALGFAMKTASLVNAVPMAMDCIAILIILIFLLHKYMYRWGEPGNTREMVTFGVLFLDSLIGSILISIRANTDHHLCNDFARLPHPCGVSRALLALSWLVTLTTMAGLVVAHMDELPGVIKVLPRIYPRTKTPESAPPSETELHIIYSNFPSSKPKYPQNTPDVWSDVSL